ncbi:ornithine cyclodeaminase [Gulosibacter macacae]|uniref:Ornithine cyclodeaminase n=1 Tax=Gulosibacter macacae TaxID=2488791 RepID=A0A3P3W1G8_9MICO|nr:tyramine oxidase subunit B [Gulosibacter macacae]RRJ87529.1 ornithine cyclodeaminase [Gulosibacter macacae]
MDTRIDFRYLSEPDMIAAGVLDMPHCVEVMNETFDLYARGDYRMAGPNNDSHGARMIFPDDPPFPTMPKGDDERRFTAMPAYLGGSFGTTGVKWYGSNLANREKGLPRSILMFTLNDTDTAAPLAIMSANLLSAMRTGAVSGVGARYFARQDSRVAGVVGPGVMGRTTLAAMAAVLPNLDTVQVRGRGQASLDDFVTWVRAELPQITDIRIVDSNEAAVHGADVVAYCATAKAGDVENYPMLRREWLKPGAFVAMPAPANIDEGLEDTSVRKVVDSYGLYEAWAMDAPPPTHQFVGIIGCKFLDLVAEGKLRHWDIEELGPVVTGDADGRRNDEEIVLFSVGGLPIEDVAWGTAIYRNAVERGIGTVLPLWNTPAMA